MSIGISREDGRIGHLKTAMLSSKMIKFLSELENGPGEKVRGDLENGDTIGYKPDLGNFPEVCHGAIKQRVYDAPRKFLCNYKEVLGK